MTKRTEPVLTKITKGVAMPAITSNRGSKSLYPFDELTEAGMSFGVKNKTAEQLSTIISNRNRKYNEIVKNEKGETVFKTKEVKDAAGVTSTVPTTDPETKQTRKFRAFNVDPKTDPDGASVRVFREL